ncbi:MAG: cupin [Acidobacteria bacterium]|nr:cupin [Acidobacteriota bacterium]
MKEKIRSAQIVVACADLDRALEFYRDRLGFRLDAIFPADAPRTVVLSGGGLVLRLEKSDASTPLTLALDGGFDGESERELFSPDGARVRLVDEQAAPALPEAVQKFAVSTLGGGAWNAGRAGMLYRDLLPERWGGRFIASHIRIPAGGPVPDYVHYHKIRFQLIYCLAGQARLVYEDQGAPFWMRAGDCVLQPPEIRHRVLECSDGFEVLEIGCPAVHETLAEHRFDLPNGKAPDKFYGGQKFLHHVAENAIWRSAENDGFVERDTGIRQATGGLADVRVLRAAAEAKFSVSHAGEFLFFFVTNGHLRLSTANGADHHLSTAAGFALPAGAEYSIEAAPQTELIRVYL